MSVNDCPVLTFARKLERRRIQTDRPRLAGPRGGGRQARLLVPGHGRGPGDEGGELLLVHLVVLLHLVVVVVLGGPWLIDHEAVQAIASVQLAVAAKKWWECEKENLVVFEFFI